MVDDGGTPIAGLGRCRKLGFLREDLLAVTDDKGDDSYLDLKVNRMYKEKPSVVQFGSLELLQAGELFSAVRGRRIPPCVDWRRTASVSATFT